MDWPSLAADRSGGTWPARAAGGRKTGRCKCEYLTFTFYDFFLYAGVYGVVHSLRHHVVMAAPDRDSVLFDIYIFMPFHNKNKHRRSSLTFTCALRRTVCMMYTYVKTILMACGVYSQHTCYHILPRCTPQQDRCRGLRSVDDNRQRHTGLVN